MPDDTAPWTGSPEPGRLRRGLVIVVGIGAVAGVAVAVLSGGRTTLDALAKLPLAALAAALGLNLLSWLGEAVVFGSLAGPDTDGRILSPLRLVRMVAVYVGGGFPALVTPFGSGGVPGWIYALTREGLSAGEAAAVVGARGMLTSTFFVAMGAVALAVVPARVAGSPAISVVGFVALVAVFASVALIVMRPRVAASALQSFLGSRVVILVVGRDRAERAARVAAAETERFSSGLRRLVRERPGGLASALAGLVVSRACLLAIMPVVLVGLGWRGPLLPIVGTVVAVQALASASPTPGGSGAVDAALAGALTVFASAPTAGAAALLWRGITFYFDLFVGWALFSRYLTGRRVEQEGRAVG